MCKKRWMAICAALVAILGTVVWGVVEHDVCFGASASAVANIRMSSRDYKDSRYLRAESLDPGQREVGTTSYTQVDEKNPKSTDSPGPVWSLTAIPYLVIDDMESYKTTFDLTNTWDLGDWTIYFWPPLRLAVAPQDPVHSGNQSMEYRYDLGDPWTPSSELRRRYDTVQNWDAAGARILTLYFYGGAHNDAGPTEQMYVGLEDSTGTYAEVVYGDNGEDMNDIKREEWTEWNILLSDFADVDLSSIAGIYLGFGNREDPVPGGGGVVNFDDIRLYTAICVPEFGPAADLNGDCVVDGADFKIMANDWLESGSAADIYDDGLGVVDFRDSAVLASQWLERQLWP